jgi:hypothetical protein
MPPPSDNPRCIEMGCQSLVLRGQRDEAINELTSALEILNAKREAAKVEWRRLFDAVGELLNDLGPNFDQGRRAYYDEMTALSQIAMEAPHRSCMICGEQFEAAPRHRETWEFGHVCPPGAV